MEKVLIDTDVIIDFLSDREPFSGPAAKVLSLCESNKIKGYITPVIISNTYYVLRQGGNHKKVIEKLKQLTLILDILNMDKEICINALNSEFKDFEDALQNFAAVKNGKIDLILTRNLKDFKSSSIGILTPETYIKSRAASS